jgi:hypothetical protein
MKPGRKARDMTGETIKWLYVDRQAEPGSYVCICQKNDCGKTRIVSQFALTRKQIKQCLDCAKASRIKAAHLLKHGPKTDTGGLNTRRLTREQRKVFHAIMKGHKRTDEARDEALGMVARATQSGSLAEELEYWTTPLRIVEARQGSSLAHVIAYGLR